MAREFDFINWVREQPRSSLDLVVGPGDDCAVLRPAQSLQIVTTDTLSEDVDFLLTDASPFQIGRKAMAVNLSDIAAMIGVPKFALVSIVTRPQLGEEFLKNLYLGLNSMAQEYSVAIVGGDTNSWSQGLVVSVTILGEASNPILRSGARVGDWIFVTGACGGSILGRHLAAKPRLHEAHILQQTVQLHAMIDISDGLAADLRHILNASRVGARLYAEQIPIHHDAHELARVTRRTPLDHALNDGEDFELIFTVSAEDGAKLRDRPPLQGLVQIGEIIEQGFYLRTGQCDEALTPHGWQHEI